MRRAGPSASSSPHPPSGACARYPSAHPCGRKCTLFSALPRIVRSRLRILMSPRVPSRWRRPAGGNRARRSANPQISGSQRVALAILGDPALAASGGSSSAAASRLPRPVHRARPPVSGSSGPLETLRRDVGLQDVRRSASSCASCATSGRPSSTRTPPSPSCSPDSRRGLRACRTASTRCTASRSTASRRRCCAPPTTCSSSWARSSTTAWCRSTATTSASSRSRARAARSK